MTLIAQRTITGAEVRPNVTLDRRRRRLSTIVARQVDRSRPFIVSVHRAGQPVAPNDLDIVLRAEWKDRLVGPQDIVLVTYLPKGGGGGGGGQILMAIAAIALMIIVPYVFGPILGAAGTAMGLSAAGAAIFTKVATTGIIMGAMALLSQASKPKANKAEEQRPVYGVSGGGNLPRPGDRIPRLYGKCWTVPDLTQPDYFEYEGEYQILYKRMTVSLGRVHILKVRVNGQVMWTNTGGYRAPFADSRIEIINPGEISDLVPVDVITSPSVQGNELPRPDSTTGAWAGHFIVNGPDTPINRIQVDISAPGGLMLNYSNSKGAQESGVGYGWRFEYAEVNEVGSVVGPWKLLDEQRGNRLERRPVRWTIRRAVPEGRYAVRGKNLYTNVPFNDKETNLTNGLQWDGLRGSVKDRRTRANTTEIAIKVKSSASLGVTSFANVEIEAEAIVPVWNGSAWVEVATNKAVWAYADIMRNAVYGGALPDSAIDRDTLLFYSNALGGYDTFDGVIRGPDSVWNAAATVLFPMRAEPVQLGRVWSLVRDDRKDVRPHVITSRQIVGGTSGLSFDLDPDNGEAHVIAEFNYQSDPKRLTSVPAQLYGNPSLTPTRRNLFGVSSMGHATHIARWLAAVAFFRRQKAQFTTEFDGRLYKRGDPITVETWFTKRAKVASVVARSGDVLTLDRAVTMAGGDMIVIRDRSGREWGPVWVNSIVGDQLTLHAPSRAEMEASTGISLANALALDNMDETTVLIGPVETIRRSYLVRSAKPSGRDRIDIEAVIDHQSVWNVLGEPIIDIPDGDDDADPLPPANLAISERLYLDANEVRSAVTVSWTRTDARALQHEVEYRFDYQQTAVTVGTDVTIEETATDGAWVSVGSTPGTSIEILDFLSGQVDVRVRSIYTAGHVSAWSQLDNVMIAGPLAPPSDVTGFDASVLGDVMTLTWDAVPDVHLSHYEIRFSPNQSGVEWGSAIPLVPKTTVTTERVPAAVGTYLVKAVSRVGIVGRNPALITSDVAAISKMNAVEELVENPDFTGAKTQVILNPSLAGLQLAYSDNVFGRADWFINGDFFLGFPSTGGLAGEGFYAFSQTVDLGAVFTSRLTAVVDAVGIDLSTNLFIWSDWFDREDFFMTEPASTWDARLEYRSTNDNPAGAPVWTDWKQVIIGDVTARAYQFRLRLMSYQFGVTPLVTRLEAQIDMPDRHEGGNDLTVSAAGLRVDFLPAFLGLKGLGITAQNMATGDRYAITDKSPTGFNIQFFNSSGTAVAKTFDFVAVGYGRKEN
jgi:predicted phage tail protein